MVQSLMQKTHFPIKTIALCGLALFCAAAPMCAHSQGKQTDEPKQPKGQISTRDAALYPPLKRDLGDAMSPELKKAIADQWLASDKLTKQGSAAMKMKKFRDAEGFYQQALSVYSGNLFASLGLADALAKQNRLYEAIAVYRSVTYLNGDPNTMTGSASNDPATQMRYAIVLAQTHQWPEAVKVYEKIVDSCPNDSLPDLDRHFSPKQSQTGLLMAMAYIRLGNAQIGQGDNVGASESFAQAVRLQPRLAITHFFAAERPGPKTSRRAELEKAAALGQGAVKAEAEKALTAYR